MTSDCWRFSHLQCRLRAWLFLFGSELPPSQLSSNRHETYNKFLCAFKLNRHFLCVLCAINRGEIAV